MKKFKLIKEYPGSPTLDTIVDHHYSTSKYGFAVYLTERSDSWKEFWQEVVEKEYEILSVIGNKNHPMPGFIVTNETNHASLNAHVNSKSKCWHIHSIKRLSDGEVFTIGDKCVLPSNEILSIKEFKYVNFGCGLSAIYEDKLFVHDYIKDLKKVKQKVFTTEDGVDIFEGDKLYRVDELFELVNNKHTERGISSNFISYSNFKYFSTKEAAKEYILMNKPCLSIKDICPLIGKANRTIYIDLDYLTTLLKKEVKSKL